MKIEDQYSDLGDKRFTDQIHSQPANGSECGGRVSRKLANDLKRMNAFTQKSEYKIINQHSSSQEKGANRQAHTEFDDCKC